jgi:hypothetical protein
MERTTTSNSLEQRLARRAEARKERDNAYVNAQSKRDHEADVKHNAEPQPWFNRRKPTQHPKSAEFERRWR